MLDQPNEVQKLQAQVNALINNQQAGNPTGRILSGWERPQPQAFGITGVNVPVSVQTSAGKVRVYFQLPAEVAASPDALMAALENMISIGIPVDAWQGKSNSSWSGNRNYNNGGGYYRRNNQRNW